MRKRADRDFKWMWGELRNIFEDMKDNAEQELHANSHLLSEEDYGYFWGRVDCMRDVLLEMEAQLNRY